ncbi:hypothetical protein [Mycolicibacterium sp. P9-22]|uniref:hypothetical protein n=1 Tax=Mycolicibacterium sp. P9-22 TaxID=2024613 RepID=UPI0018836A5A|nr:hypothetical protein [Mycolicibacterium sp. P9-22]
MHRQNIASPGGTTWEGDAKDAALNRVTTDISVVDRHGGVLREAAGIAEDGVTDIGAAKREAIAAINAAEADGFRVSEDLSVTDTRPYDETTAASRVTAAIEHAEDVRWSAERLAQTDALIGQRLEAKATDLEGITFDGEGDGRDPTIQMLDDETEEPSSPDDGGYKPHPDYPDHKPNGEWGPKNSGVEGDVEAQKAFDERQRRTGIPIERQKTWVYLTDPETGKTLRREYDGLEPIPGQPGTFTGLEHKLGNKAPTKHQEHFDDLVDSGIPARGTLNGEPIEVVDTELIRTPRPGDPTVGAAAGGSAGPGATPAPGAGGIPPAVVDGGGSVPAVPAPAGTPAVPDWGTQLTPQQMIDSGDPALIVLGQELRRRMAEQGIVDPSGIA